MGNYAPIHPLCVTLLLTVVKFHKSTLIHSNHGLAANPSPFSDKILAPDRKLLRQTKAWPYAVPRPTQIRRIECAGRAGDLRKLKLTRIGL